MRSSTLLLIVMLTTAASSTSQAQDSTRYIGGGDLRISGMGGPIFHIGDLDISNIVYTSVGGGGGLLIDQSVMIGAYGQGLTGPQVHTDFSENGRTQEGTFRFGHGGPWLMWSMMPRKAIHPFVSVQAGWGAAEWIFDDPYDDDDEDGSTPDSLRTFENKHDQVFVLTGSVGAELNVVRWFRPNVYVGYRSVSGLDLEQTESDDLDGFFFGVSFLFGGFGERRK